MLTTKEARKIPYEQLDEESKEYYYQLFKKYVVRKQIADNNKILSSLFASGGKRSMARNFSGNFNSFNSTFVGSDLIKHLNYHEIHTDYLSEMSEDRFNFHLHERGNDFYRKIALICFSGKSK